jgi:peroxiredoxin
MPHSTDKKEIPMNLNAELKAVTESVRQQAPAEVFSTMEKANAKLAASGILDKVLMRGSRMPDFELPDATGKLVKSVDLRKNRLLLVSFYRGAWCPYCNLELKALHERQAEIAAAGVTLVAISPQTPDYSLTTQQKHDLKFPVLSDQGNKVARQFGLVFTVDASLKPIYQAFGIDLKAHNGDESFELPVPATYLIARDGSVLEAFINTDYRSRLELETALEWIAKAKR